MASEFVGVDGCPYGWVSVGFNDSGDYELKKFPSFHNLVEYYDAAKLILVDMPIGLPEGKAERHCDPVVRRLLGPKGPAVFRAPTRQAVSYLADNPDDGEGAKRVQKRITGKKLTIQTLAIMPKIIAVDRVMRSRGRGSKPEIREVHPEFCFWALNDQSAINSNKKKAPGIEARLGLLEQMEPRSREIYRAGCHEFLRKHVAKDDIIDALSAAVTAWKGSRSDRLKALPKDLQCDGKDLPMEMVYWVQ